MYGSSPERAYEPEHPSKDGNASEDDEEEEEEAVAAAAEGDEQEEALMVPQVKVAEDGSLIIDEERSVRSIQACDVCSNSPYDRFRVLFMRKMHVSPFFSA